MLILSHRDELVRQPVKYFDVPVGIEQGPHREHGEEVVSASVPSIVRRLNMYREDDFDVIVVDEAHHAAAASYRKIIRHFKPRLLLGFTATPNRNDGVGLDSIFDDVIFERDLEWGIKNGYLSDISCLKVDIGIDLRGVATRMGDYAADELEKTMNIESANRAIADAYRRYAHGPTLVFAAGVAHARAIAKEIDGAVAVAGGEDRSGTLELFRRGDVPCLVNCMVFTEGTDLPNIETVIIARPTSNVSLYTQMVGRGTRLCEGKDRLQLIDCVGASSINICTASSLIGLDVSVLDPKDRPDMADDLFDLPDEIQKALDQPKYWIRNAQIVDLWAKGKKYNLHGINFFRLADGTLLLSKPKFRLAPPDKLGRIFWNGVRVPYQRAIDDVYRALNDNHNDTRNLWDRNIAKKWGEYTATDKQKYMVQQFLPEYKTEGMTKAEAGAIITRMFMGRNL